MPVWWQNDGTGGGLCVDTLCGTAPTATTTSSLWTPAGCWTTTNATATTDGWIDTTGYYTTCTSTTSGSHTHTYTSYAVWDEAQQCYRAAGLMDPLGQAHGLADQQHQAALAQNQWARETAEQQARALVQQQGVLREAFRRAPPAEARHPRDAAEARAEQLLLEHLTPVQRETYRLHGWFVVQGGRSQKSYRIRSGSLAGNIDALDDNRRLCAHLERSMIPLGDHLLAQALWLMHDEYGFLGVANLHPAVPNIREGVMEQLALAEAAVASAA